MNLLKWLSAILLSVSFASMALASSASSGTLVLKKPLVIKGRLSIGNDKWGVSKAMTIPAGTYKAVTGGGSEVNGKPCSEFLYDCMDDKAKRIYYSTITVFLGKNNIPTIRYEGPGKYVTVGEAVRSTYPNQTFMTLYKNSSVTKNTNPHQEEIECSVKKYCRDAGGYDCIYAMGMQTEYRHDELTTTTHVDKYLDLSGKEIGSFTYFSEYKETKADSQGKCILNAD